MKRQLAVLIFSFICASCDPAAPFIGKEYEWVQQQDGLGMKAPITFRVHYRWGRDTLYWSAILTDVRGVQDIQVTTIFNTDLGLMGRSECKYFDDDNWSCAIYSAKREVLIAQTMKDGTLTWNYWGTIRPMTKRLLVLNKRIPN